MDSEQTKQRVEALQSELAIIRQAKPAASAKLQQIEAELKDLQAQTSAGSIPWLRVQLARHPKRPHSLDYIQRLGADTVFAVGNGANDAAMLEHAALGVAVIGPEGAAVETLLKAKVVVPYIRAALELLLFPKRLAATLRR